MHVFEYMQGFKAKFVWLSLIFSFPQKGRTSRCSLAGWAAIPAASLTQSQAPRSSWITLITQTTHWMYQHKNIPAYHPTNISVLTLRVPNCTKSLEPKQKPQVGRFLVDVSFFTSEQLPPSKFLKTFLLISWFSWSAADVKKSQWCFCSPSFWVQVTDEHVFILPCECEICIIKIISGGCNLSL